MCIHKCLLIICFYVQIIVIKLQLLQLLLNQSSDNGHAYNTSRNPLQSKFACHLRRNKGLFASMKIQYEIEDLYC